MAHIGILHPGQMGISIAAAARNTGHTVHWASEGRSLETRQRAESQSLVDAGTLEHLCRACTVILSVCPPHAAEEVAHAVAETGFAGLYADCNAISPQRARRIGAALEARGIAFVDGGIIGGPAWQPGSTWLYLAGSQAGQVAEIFAAGPLETEILGEEIGQASALKMCYAAYTKGTTALLAAVLAAAEGLQVREALQRQWGYDDASFPEQATARVRRVTAKAWRFEGEMEEIAATFGSVGVPEGFHRAAAELYRRLAEFRGRATAPALEDVLAAVLKRD